MKFLRIPKRCVKITNENNLIKIKKKIKIILPKIEKMPSASARVLNTPNMFHHETYINKKICLSYKLAKTIALFRNYLVNEVVTISN